MKRWIVAWGLCVIVATHARGAEPFGAGYGEADITPNVKQSRVWLAGYGPGRQATAVHDPIMARAAVLRHGETKVAIISVDLIGLQRPAVQEIRARLPELQAVIVTSTHNHEGPDVIGLWGPNFLQSGVDPVYLEQVIAGAVEATREAAKNLASVKTFFGRASAPQLLNDSRQPIVLDPWLRVLVMRNEGMTDGPPRLVLAQWNCHPEAMGSRNTVLTADFSAATVDKLREALGCPIVYCTGTVGGLLAPPRREYFDDDGKLMERGTFAATWRYGEEVADAAVAAVGDAEPIECAPIRFASRETRIPVDNPYYTLAQAFGVIQERPFAVLDAGRRRAFVTEVGCLRLGDLRIACIPGEIYPELVYGEHPEPAVPGVDYPDAPLEPSIAESMPHERWMLLGLANDEIGYLIPKRQWDWHAPFAYGRRQYGEINSCSPEAAPRVMEAVQQCIREVE